MKPQHEVTTLSIESIDRFHRSLFARGRSPKTIKAYTTDLRMFLKDLGSEVCEMWELEEMGMTWLTMNRKVVAPKTTARRLTSLRRFAAWAGHPDYFGDYKVPMPAVAQPHPLPEGVSGVRRLIEVARQQNQKTLVALCGLCGLRISEALSIRASNFNLEAMTLKVLGKGEKERIIPLSQETWEIVAKSVIQSRVDNDAPLVGLQDRFARRVITDLGVRAGLQRHISSHDLRATFGTEVYNKTLNIRLAQELLGHSSSKQTELYTGVAMTEMRKAVEL